MGVSLSMRPALLERAGLAVPRRYSVKFDHQSGQQTIRSVVMRLFEADIAYELKDEVC